MSKAKPPKKKVVVTTGNKEQAKKQPAKPATAGRKAKAAKPRSRANATTTQVEKRALTFGRDFYIWAGAGFGLVVLGLLLMTGGGMPDPDTWDPDIIYSTRITLLAPITMLAGFGLITYAIFKK